MSPENVAALVIAAVALATGALLWVARAVGVRGAIRKVRARRIGDVTERERGRVVGTVEIDTPIEAPLSARECAFWTVVIQEKGLSDLWMTVLEEQGGVDFTLHDESGKARVAERAQRIEAALELDARYESGLLHDADPRLEKFLAARGHTSRGRFFNKTLRYREGVISPGERVAVVGVGRWEPDPDEEARASGYREAARPQRLVMSAGGARDRLLLSDDTSITR